MNTPRHPGWARPARGAQRGFTLVETIVAVAILSVVMSSAGATVFHALRTEKAVTDEGLATNELRKGFAWFVADAQMAQDTSLVDQGPADSSAAFTWVDQYQGSGMAHTASYGLDGTNLVRSYDGASHVVAHGVNSVAFSRSGRVITAQVTVDAGRGESSTLSAQTVMRPS